MTKEIEQRIHTVVTKQALKFILAKYGCWERKKNQERRQPK